MKIVHISTSNRGGAAIAARRLHEGLLNIGLDSKMLCLRVHGELSREMYQFKEGNLIRKVLRKVKVKKCSYRENSKIQKRISGNYEILTFPNTNYCIHEHPLVKQADVINLHWVSNFLDYKSFFLSINKPITWTLHDMNPFSGLTHYHSDLTNNMAYIEPFEKHYKSVKAQILSKLNQLHVVSPSQWLYEEAKKSQALNRFSHSRIPYGLDTNIFTNRGKEIARRRLSLPQDKKIVLFVASHLQNRRKGLDLFLECKKIINDEDTLFVTTGNSVNILDKDIKCLGSFYDETELSYVYSAADLFVIPSREDNLPNTMLESLACGTPVVGFNVGGIPDAVINGVTGLIAQPEDANDLAIKVKHLLENDNMRAKMSSNAREFAVNNFSLSLQSNRYKELYDSLNGLESIQEVSNQNRIIQ